MYFYPFEQFTTIYTYYILLLEWAVYYADSFELVWLSNLVNGNYPIIFSLIGYTSLFLFFFICLYTICTRTICARAFTYIYKQLYAALTYFLPEQFIRVYYDFYFFLFIFICFLNITELVPMQVLLTGQFLVTFLLAFIIWCGILIQLLYVFGNNFFSFFIVEGLPGIMVCFILALEIASYCSQLVTIALRLCANIVAGHIVFEIVYILLSHLLFFVFTKITTVISLVGIWVIFICVLFVLEFVIACIQAYIFLLLSVFYFSEIINSLECLYISTESSL